MLRFVIEPASRDYYRQKGISFGFHQLLRVLDDPVSMIDPTGFLSDRDTIVGHVMQVVHLNPVYDLQLIQMFPDGLEDFERQVQAMVDGTHPRHAHHRRDRRGPRLPRRLLDYVRRFRADPDDAAAGARGADAARRPALRRRRAHLRHAAGLHRLLPHAADAACRWQRLRSSSCARWTACPPRCLPSAVQPGSPGAACRRPRPVSDCVPLHLRGSGRGASAARSYLDFPAWLSEYPSASTPGHKGLLRPAQPGFGGTLGTAIASATRSTLCARRAAAVALHWCAVLPRRRER